MFENISGNSMKLNVFLAGELENDWPKIEVSTKTTTTKQIPKQLHHKK